MAFAVIGHGLGFDAWPVSLLMVCHTQRLEWVKSIVSTVAVHLSLSLCLVFSLVIRSVAVLAVSTLVLALLGARKKSSHSSSQEGTWFFRTLHGMCFLAASVSILQYALCASSMSEALGTGRLSAAVLVLLTNSGQLTLRKFHVQTDFPFVDWTNDDVVISDGQCWEQGNLSRTRCTGSGSSPMALAKARSGFVSVFKCPEVKE